MKKNLEIKYKPGNSREISYITGLLKNYSHTTEKQTDIYYKTIRDRLKLRIINDTEGSLILYNRAEKKNKRISKYTISKTKESTLMTGRSVTDSGIIFPFHSPLF